MLKFHFKLSRATSSHFGAIHSLNVRCSRKLENIIKTPYFGGSKSFKVINVDTIKKLVTSACYVR